MVIRKCLRGLDNLMQICIHKFINHVDIVETPPVDGHHDIFQSNHVFMSKMSEELQFSQSSQCINAVVECIMYLLNCNLLIGFPVNRRAHNTVGPSTNRLDWHIFGVNLKQSLPHGIVMLPWRLNSIWRLNWSCHFPTNRNEKINIKNPKTKGIAMMYHIMRVPTL